MTTEKPNLIINPSLFTNPKNSEPLAPQQNRFETTEPFIPNQDPNVDGLRVYQHNVYHHKHAKQDR